MKIAIISDIHSNLEALEACCAVAEAEGVEQYICLGDMVGYGPDPVAVLEKLRSLPNFQCVLGNHDEYMFSFIDQDATPPVQMVAEWTIEQLQKEQLEFLKSLNYILTENGVSYVHSSLHQPNSWTYITTPERAKQCMNAAHTNLTFYGHVHMPMIFHEKTDNEIELVRPEGNKLIPLFPNRRYVINVGSVGQPRDDNNDACFVIYDEEKHAITFHRVAYDYQATVNKIHENNLHPEFAHRLESGR